MEKIASGVYLENSYPGVIVGAALFGDGVLLIDSPLRPDDGRAWLSALRGIKGGADRLLVYLDAHPDRTLGGRILDSTVIAHESVFLVFEQRSAIFKTQTAESGQTWETVTGLSGIRWLPPDLAFSKTMHLQGKDSNILLEYRPGPEKGAIWVILPEEEVVFIGDLVTVNQPPFIAYADLEKWDETLELLSSKTYRDYTIVSSRDGVIAERDIRNMRKFIAGVHKQFERMARRQTSPKAVDKMVDRLLSMFEFSPRYRSHYHHRLQYGLQYCYVKNYFNPKNRSKQDE